MDGSWREADNETKTEKNSFHHFKEIWRKLSVIHDDKIRVH
jgi:hypothetical protein